MGLVDLEALRHQQAAAFASGNGGSAAAAAQSALPSVAQRGLMKALTLVAPACEDQAARDQYWARTLKPLVDGFAAVVGRPDLKKMCHDDGVRTAVESLLESFIGK